MHFLPIALRIKSRLPKRAPKLSVQCLVDPSSSSSHHPRALPNDWCSPTKVLCLWALPELVPAWPTPLLSQTLQPSAWTLPALEACVSHGPWVSPSGCRATQRSPVLPVSSLPLPLGALGPGRLFPAVFSREKQAGPTAGAPYVLSD